MKKCPVLITLIDNHSELQNVLLISGEDVSSVDKCSDKRTVEFRGLINHDLNEYMQVIPKQITVSESIIKRFVQKVQKPGNPCDSIEALAKQAQLVGRYWRAWVAF